MDGSCLGTLPARLTAADTVFVLDMPRVLCLYRVLIRGITQRGQHRADLAEGCAEQLPDLAFLRWIWRFPRDDLQPVLDQVNAVSSTKPVTILRSLADARRYFHELRAHTI